MPEIDPNMVEVYVFRHSPAGVEFLLLRRAADAYMGDTWQPIYGAVEPGERATTAAQREMFEEAQLTPIRLWQVDTVEGFYVAKFDRIMLPVRFVAEVAPDAEAELSREHVEFKWVLMTHIANELLWPGQKRAIVEIVNHIITPSPAERYLRIEL